jgi:hypothetical protein
MHIILAITGFIIIAVLLVTLVALPFVLIGIGVMAAGVIGIAAWTLIGARHEKAETQQKLDAMPPWYKR